jgi:hypothetical protein
MDNADIRYRSIRLYAYDKILTSRVFHFPNRSQLEGACFQTPSQMLVESNL